jgi:hypothetical protein
MPRTKLALSLAAALLLAATASAQERLANSTPEQRAKLQTEFMTRKLALKSDQIPKVEAINLKYAQKMEPVIKGNEGPLMKVRSAKAIDEEKGAELQKVLTPEQYKQYLAAKEEMRQHVEQHVMEKREGGGTTP